jgi:hypothetical protein
MSLKDQLQSLPSDWRLCRVGKSKQPLGGKGWFDIKDYSPDDAAGLNGNGPPAWGLKSGPCSGVVVLDLDDEGWDGSIVAITGHSFEELPETIAWTSGKPGRSGRAFQVDPEWWPHLANRRAWKNPAGRTCWELRWDRCQSVIMGHHPETGAYRWLEGCSPAELGDPAEAPEWLLRALVVEELPNVSDVEPSAEDADRAVAMLGFIAAADHQSYDDWLRVGMALHHTDPGLLSAWVEWCKKMADFDEAECLRKWESFGKGHRGRPATIATLYKLAKAGGYVEPKRSRAKAKAKGKPARPQRVEVDAGAREGEVSAGDGGEGVDEPRDTATADERWPFAMLGFNGDDYFYQPGESGQVTKINKNAHTTNSLIALADLGFWARTFPRVDREGNAIGIDWKMALNTLFRRQHRVGCYDPSRIRGIGAWWDGGRPVFHLGDRLVADGRTWPVLEPPQTDCLYQRLPRREGPGAAVPLGDQEGLELIEIAEGFHWESKTSGALLAGWTALAPICGALDWRPHVWLNAAAGSGKSSLMDLYVGPLLTDMGLFVLGNTTEAGIRQKLKSDALPVIFDEAESNEKRDLDRMQNVLGLARSSSSEGRGTTVKGSASSEAMMYNVRSMFMLSSINMSLKQGADRSRFSVLSLRVPDELDAEGKATHWRDLKARLVATVNSDTGRRLVARMVNLIPEVRLAARVLAAEAALALDGARAGDQIGALLAGAWCLQHQQAPTAEQARAFVAQFDWAHHGAESDEKASDQKNCLQVILQSRIRLELEKSTVTRTVAELIEAVQRGAGDLSPVPGVVAAAELARHGLLVRGSAGITVSNTAEGVKRLLRDTQWASGGWATLLRALPGARRTASAVWFPELKAMARGTEIPNELLEKPLQ